MESLHAPGSTELILWKLAILKKSCLQIHGNPNQNLHLVLHRNRKGNLSKNLYGTQKILYSQNNPEQKEQNWREDRSSSQDIC